MQTNDLENTLRKINEVLSSLQLKFHLTGGLVSSYYGEPRFTMDIDFVVHLSAEEKLKALLSALEANFIVDPDLAQEAFRKESMFQALDKETMIKIDFHVSGMSEEEFARSQTTEILPGIEMPIASLEDSILSKLLWIKNGSHKSRQDVEMMIKLNKDLDQNYLKDQAKELNLLELLEEFI